MSPTADTDEEYLVIRKLCLQFGVFEMFFCLSLVIIQLAIEKQVNMSRNEGIGVKRPIKELLFEVGAFSMSLLK